VDGITVVLVLAEIVDLAAGPPLGGFAERAHHALDAVYDREWNEYQERSGALRARSAVRALTGLLNSPACRGSPRCLCRSDDLGTRYHANGSATGGSDAPWRSEWRIEPGVPADASELKSALEGSGGEPLVLTLPSRD